MEEVKINREKIPQVDKNIFCRMTLEAIERFYRQPGIKEEFEMWQQEYNRQKALREAG